MEVLRFLSFVRHMGKTKASCRRLYKTIIEGIRNGTFAYEDESMSREEQIMTFQKDEKRECATTFLRDLQDKLIFGHIELSELR